MNCRPTSRVKAARAEAKFPEDDSIIVVWSLISPRSAARLRIQNAGRSLMLPTGFMNSSLAKRSTPSRAMRTCGVGRRVLRSRLRRSRSVERLVSLSCWVRTSPPAPLSLTGEGERRDVVLVVDLSILELDSCRKAHQHEARPRQCGADAAVHDVAELEVRADVVVRRQVSSEPAGDAEALPPRGGD